jgi:putative NIF3 family GTP cyclohydrolase 1 type 2
VEIKDLFNILGILAPGLSTEDFTNPNLATSTRTISKIGVCVDPTAKNIHNAVDKGIDVLISYHPWQGEAGSVIQDRGLGIWPLHAVWDNAADGIIYTLAGAIGLMDCYPKGEIIFGNVEILFRELIERCQNAIGKNILSYSGELKHPVSKVGIWAGPGFLPNYKKFWEACLIEGCSTILSSEMTLSALRFSQANQLQLIDLGHSTMAKPGMSRLAEVLKESLSSDFAVFYFDDIYACNYYTNCAFAEQFTESEDIFFSNDL